jgi:hypothetical protein
MFKMLNQALNSLHLFIFAFLSMNFSSVFESGGTSIFTCVFCGDYRRYLCIQNAQHFKYKWAPTANAIFGETFAVLRLTF